MLCCQASCTCRIDVKFVMHDRTSAAVKPASSEPTLTSYAAAAQLAPGRVVASVLPLAILGFRAWKAP